MRGIHDTGFCARAIDLDPTLSEEEKLSARVRLLETVISDQREIIRSSLHLKRPDEALQVFIPYKEVLPLYDAGLRLPDDVTVMWTNDNFGHIRRYPDEKEQTRRGGHALYFHSSYWSPAPLSYLFINSIPLAQTGAELRKAYENGIRKIWVDNVGALKPLEQDMEYFLAFGWDAARPEALVHRVHDYLTAWFNEQFSGNFGEECARIYEGYAQITNVCKVEHLTRDVFSQTAYGDEAGRRINRLQELYTRVCRVHDALPEAERDAFFELLGMKVSASYFINAAFYYADRSRLKTMANGKWKGILTPEAFPPPVSCLYTDAKPALSIGETQMGVIVWNEEQESASPCLTFDEKGVQTKWLEIFNRGSGSFSFTIENNCPFLSLSETEGEVKTETRVLITLTGTPQNGSLLVRSDNGEERLIRIAPAPDLWLTFSASEMQPSPAHGFRRIPYLDRMQGACKEAQTGGARLERKFTQPVSGECTVELTRYLTLDRTGRMRIRVLLDGKAQELESLATDEWRPGWFEAVRYNGEKLRCTFLDVSAGEHTLVLEAIDRYFTLGRVTLYFGDAPVKKSQLGPELPESPAYETIPAVDEAALKSDALARFHIAAKDVPPVKLTYAGHGYWNIDRLYVPNEERDQAFAPPRYPFAAGEKKELIPLFGRGIFVETDDKICLEAEHALEESSLAWRTSDKRGVIWQHLSAETDGGTGLAMMVEEPGLYWEKGGPSLNFRCRFTGGKYYVWLLMRFDDPSNDAVTVGIDKIMQPRGEQYGRGGFFTYSSQFQWVWLLLSELEIPKGEHVFALAAVKSGLRIDRIYLTKGTELPPDDLHFTVGPRKED